MELQNRLRPPGGPLPAVFRRVKGPASSSPQWVEDRELLTDACLAAREGPAAGAARFRRRKTAQAADRPEPSSAFLLWTAIRNTFAIAGTVFVVMLLLEGYAAALYVAQFIGRLFS